MKLLGQLDRYVLRSWLLIFGVTAIGFPIVNIVIKVTDNLERLLGRGLNARQILVSYVYDMPENIYLVMPAAVLFATVFTIGNLGRSSEITACKAGGRSFHRLCLPLFVIAALASGLAVFVGEISPGATARSLELQKARPVKPKTYRYNFVYRADDGWVYTIRILDVATRALKQLVLERQGAGEEYPGLAVVADSATYSDSLRSWQVWHGTSRRIRGPGSIATFDFERMRLRTLNERPEDLLVDAKLPSEMRYAELGRYIQALKRSGNDTSALEVEQALKLALPATCLVITLFGAPLAVSAPRTGAAMGIAISLGTTIVYLLLIQLSQAVGTSGLMNPVLSAWVPNIIFFLTAIWLLVKVKT